jgi:hypothetical protein
MTRAGRRKKRQRKAAAVPVAPPDSSPTRSHRPMRDQAESDRIPPELGLLEVAVPLWIDQFRPMPWDERMKIRDEALGIIGCTAECDAIALLICGARGKIPGRVAGAFNAIAKALALGALQPGGVTFAGMHFEAAP